MKVRGALHVHSTLSHDGKLSLPEVAAFYRSKGFQLVAIGEHSQDMSAEKVELLTEQCAGLSSTDFLMMPGIEFTCRTGMHILGVGCTAMTLEREAAAVARHIRQHDGFAVLAHPKRFGWTCDTEILQSVDAVEIWNVGYDGKYAPSPTAQRSFHCMRQLNPALMAIASHDLHRYGGFYDVAVEMDLQSLDRNAVLNGLRSRAYRIRSSFVNMGPDGELGKLAALIMTLVSHNVHELRRARALLWRSA